MSWIVAPLLQVDSKYVYLGLLILSYMAISSYVWFQRRKMQKEMESASAAEREFLAAADPEYRHALPNRKGISGTAAGWVGCLSVNGPILPLFVGPMAIAQLLLEIESQLFLGLLLVFGFVLAWCWWSVSVTVWRRWAARAGLDEEEIQWRGENASFLWPPGHFFEKTELEHILALWRKRKR